ncbi:MAG TPA: hypothetical protein RMH99_08225 [Sandaracinaceae bacterium LLY-WYZ-13_1]|nr:hypothetical protein [Sandaracinaceae bacterium LLY-WYZ-13_1]
MTNRRHPFTRCALLALALTACEDRCPDGSTPVEGRRTMCDEETRMCTTETVDVCPCDPGAMICEGSTGECDPISGVGEWLSQTPTEDLHEVDGRFTGDEWAETTRLEGLFTDVYMDYRGGRLYFLNDWRANDEGITPDCFNYFQIRFGEDWLDLRVYGDGHVEVTKNDRPVEIAASGAYGFGPSPTQAEPHTIYEFSLELEASQIDVCCFDPLTESTCDELAHEPAVMSLRVEGDAVRVRRGIVPGTVPRLPEGAACGNGEGICEDGLTCEDAVCVRRGGPPPSPDGGTRDAGPPDPPD